MEKHGPSRVSKTSWFYRIVTILFFVSLLSVTIFMLWTRSKKSTDLIIYDDIQSLGKIFDQINKQCHILGFDHDKNYIDFLTVTNFVGSTVGSMNLMFADKWAGPYLHVNPMIQGQRYQIIHTQQGYFIVPGDGVILGNGKKVGTDFVLDKSSDMDLMLKDNTLLLSPVGPLGIEIQVEAAGLLGVTGKVLTLQDADSY